MLKIFVHIILIIFSTVMIVFLRRYRKDLVTNDSAINIFWKNYSINVLRFLKYFIPIIILVFVLNIIDSVIVIVITIISNT